MSRVRSRAAIERGIQLEQRAWRDRLLDRGVPLFWLLTAAVAAVMYASPGAPIRIRIDLTLQVEPPLFFAAGGGAADMELTLPEPIEDAEAEGLGADVKEKVQKTQARRKKPGPGCPPGMQCKAPPAIPMFAGAPPPGAAPRAFQGGGGLRK